MAIGMTTAAIAVGSAVFSGVMSNRNKRINNDSIRAANARRDASIDAQISRQQDHLVKQTRVIQETDRRNTLRVEQAAMAQTAANQVEAAAAGTQGMSVDLTSIETAASAGRAQGNRERQYQQQLRRMEDKSRDIALGGEASKQVLDLDTSLTGAGLSQFIRNAGIIKAGFTTGLSL